MLQNSGGLGLVSFRRSVRGAAAAMIWGLIPLAAVNAKAQTSVNLIWGQSTGTNVAGYYLYFGPDSGNYTNIIDLGNVTSTTVSDLVTGAVYYFAVAAYDSSGIDSVVSNEINYNPTNSLSGLPTLDPISNVTISQNAAIQVVSLSGISSGGTNSLPPVVVTAVSDNPGLIPTPTVTYISPNTTGTLTFTPLPNAYGLAHITVTVNNGQPTNNLTSQTFTVTVNAINQPPTLDPLSNVIMSENGGTQIVALTGISSGATNESQVLTLTAISDNPAVIPNPTVSYISPGSAGTLTFTPAVNAYGTASITVTVNDGGPTNNLTSQTFTVTVNWVNQPPTLNSLSNLTINENAATQTVALSGITSGTSSEAQTLNITAVSDNPSLVANPTVNYTSPSTTGALTFAPLTNAVGAANITVTVNDGAATNNLISRTFAVNVIAETPPTISAIPSQSIQKNGVTQPISFWINDAETVASNLVLSASSSNSNLVTPAGISFGGSGSNRSVTVTPNRGQTGSSTITVTVSDGVLKASSSFGLSVNGNGPKTLLAGTLNGLVITSMSLDTTGTTLTWTSSAGAVYQVLSKDGFDEPAWTSLSGDISGADFSTSWTDTTAGSADARFYLVKQVQ